MSRRGWLLFLAMCVIWGIPYLLIKVAVGHLTPATLVFGRTAVATVILLPLAARQLRGLLPYWRPLLLYTAVEMGIPWLLLSDAERRLSSSLSGLLIAAVPLVGAVFARFTGERLHRRRLLGLLVGLGGVAALLGVDVHRGDVGAVLEVGVVVLGYTAGPFIIARRLSDLPGISVVAVSVGLCMLAYAPAGILQWPAHVPPASVIASVLTLAVVCTAIAFVVFFKLIAEVGATRSMVITYVNPAVAVLFGVTILNEAFTLGTGIGFALIIAGSVLATRRDVVPEQPEPLPVSAPAAEPVPRP
jgi:drug/metabolite transporter (DMT)-like permease